MKKSFILLLISLVISSAAVYSESWDDYKDLDKAWDGQKTITNKEFEEVMDALNANEKKKEEKLRKKKIKKISGGGTSLHNELNPDKDIQEIKPFKPKDEGILVNIPVNLIIDGKVLEKGYYKVIGEKKDGKIHILFYQSQFFKGEIEAESTEDDYGEKLIDFARILPYNESFVKIIFGSVDFNAYAFIPFNEK